MQAPKEPAPVIIVNHLDAGVHKIQKKMYVTLFIRHKNSFESTYLRTTWFSTLADDASHDDVARTNFVPTTAFVLFRCHCKRAHITKSALLNIRTCINLFEPTRKCIRDFVDII